MTFANWCIALAVLLPIGWSMLSKAQPSYNNRQPRAYEEALTGWRQRAHWAHLNSIESFAPFAAAVLVAQQAEGVQGMIDLLAGIFIAFRLLYGACYLADLGALRTLVYSLGLGCVLGLFVVAAGWF
ncbi:MAG: hypothetical protein EXR36_01750 [Betaproteobacteria bacterium]|nr:hypothetical protein [Betaproteobacteria bacterium]